MDASNTQSVFNWHCPLCKHALAETDSDLECRPCQRKFPKIGPIPDLRTEGASWIDIHADRRAAQALWERSQTLTLEQLIREVYSSQPGRDENSIRLRTRQLMEAPLQKKQDFEGWLRQYTPTSGLLMDLGCGGGSLIAGAALCGHRGMGIDVSMTWLVVAHKMIVAWGGEPILAAAMAEQLPLPDAAIDGIISFDVIEHVADPASYLKEINRVVASQGKVLITTPNRFSITPEPHVFVWGVGWLPRRFQQAYVKWRNGMDYRYTRLLSRRELGKLLAQYTDFEFKLHPGVIPDSEIGHFGPMKKPLARLYNKLLSLPLIRSVFLLLGPFFYVSSYKP